MSEAEESTTKRRQRAERILDVAADLVLRWGYKRVTIEEVAKRAEIGKGTIYLHWKTREALFLAVLARAGVKLIDESIAAIENDPEEILLHRVMRSRLLLLKGHPLLLAVLTRDAEVLGGLVGDSSARPLQGHKMAMSRDYFELLRSHGLLRTDMPPEAQFYAINATTLGFYLMDPLLPAEERRSLEERADIIAGVMREAFEPAAPPKIKVLLALAPKIIDKFRQLRNEYARFAQGNST